MKNLLCTILRHRLTPEVYEAQTTTLNTKGNYESLLGMFVTKYRCSRCYALITIKDNDEDNE